MDQPEVNVLPVGCSRHLPETLHSKYYSDAVKFLCPRYAEECLHNFSCSLRRGPPFPVINVDLIAKFLIFRKLKFTTFWQIFIGHNMTATVSPNYMDFEI